MPEVVPYDSKKVKAGTDLVARQRYFNLKLISAPVKSLYIVDATIQSRLSAEGLQYNYHAGGPVARIAAVGPEGTQNLFSWTWTEAEKKVNKLVCERTEERMLNEMKSRRNSKHIGN